MFTHRPHRVKYDHQGHLRILPRGNPRPTDSTLMRRAWATAVEAPAA
jgi:hypothetical protein